MKREILFRGWFQGINGTEMWVYGYLVKQTNGNWEITNGETSWTVDDVGQFTGLFDKNGKEIYEGDIVLFPNNSKVHIVDFYQSGFILKSVDGQIVVYNIKPQYIEVVGNIHNNPDLLK